MIDSPWLYGWAEIGRYIRMHPDTAARTARIRRACSFLNRHPRVKCDTLDAVLAKATK